MADASTMMGIAVNDELQRRVKYFMQKAATAVLAEAGVVPNHDLRAAYANKVLDGTASVYEMTVSVVTNSTIAAAGGATDSDIEFAVNSFWDAFSGATAAGV